MIYLKVWNDDYETIPCPSTNVSWNYTLLFWCYYLDQMTTDQINHLLIYSTHYSAPVIMTNTEDLVVNNTNPTSCSLSLQYSELWFLSGCSRSTFPALFSVTSDISMSLGWIGQLDAPESRWDSAPKCDSLASTKPWITALSSPTTPWIFCYALSLC